MTEEQIKAKAKEQFPNDEFDQQIVIDAINWATKELQEENERLKKGGCRLVNCNGRENGIELRKAKIKIEQLEKQIEKAKDLLNILLGQMIEGALHTPTILEVEKFLKETE